MLYYYFFLSSCSSLQAETHPIIYFFFHPRQYSHLSSRFPNPDFFSPPHGKMQRMNILIHQSDVHGTPLPFPWCRSCFESLPACLPAWWWSVGGATAAPRPPIPCGPSSFSPRGMRFHIVCLVNHSLKGCIIVCVQSSESRCCRLPTGKGKGGEGAGEGGGEIG